MPVARESRRACSTHMARRQKGPAELRASGLSSSRVSCKDRMSKTRAGACARVWSLECGVCMRCACAVPAALFAESNDELFMRGFSWPLQHTLRVTYTLRAT